MDSPLVVMQSRLFRACCVGSAVLHLVSPILALAVLGRLPAATVLLIASGLLQLALLRAPGMALRARSTILVVAVQAVLVLGWLRLGWAPLVVAMSGALVVMAGLLLGRGAVIATVLVQTASLIAGSSGAYLLTPMPESSLDPARFANWVRVTAILVVAGSVTALLLRQVVTVIEAVFARVRADHERASARLAAAREVRVDRLRHERGLRATQKVQSVGQLSGGLAHLLNNALMVVRGALEKLRVATRPAEIPPAAAAIIDVTQRVGSTLRDLMVFSRGDEPEPRPLELSRELDAIVAKIAPTIGADITLRVHGTPGLTVHVEPLRLHQLVLNLVLNAKDASEPSGEVRLSTRLVGDRAQLVVEDNGAGMAADVASRAFDAFFTTRDRDRYAGLGLTVAAAIAEQAGGSVQLASQPGVGTRVVVELPCTVDPAVRAAVAPPPLLHAPTLGSEPATPAPEASPASTSASPPDEIPAWTQAMTRWTARVGVPAIAAITVASALTGFDMRIGEYGVAAAGVLVFAFAGWAPSLTMRRRALLVIGAIAALALQRLATLSFLAPITVVGLMLSVSAAALLGPRWASPLLLLLIMLALLAVGWLHETGELSIDLARVAMDRPANWRRIAFTLAIGNGVLGLSVLVVVDHARRGIGEMDSARRRLQEAEQQEADETTRILTLEREAGRLERIAATGRAVGSVGHDVNNSLQAMLLPASMLRRPRVTDAERARLVDRLGQAFEYARALAAQFGVSESAAPAPERALDLSAEVRRTVEILRPSLNPTIALSCTVADGCFVRMADVDVRRLLFNLVANARDAIEGAGEIRVALGQAGDRVQLEVADTGHGMSEEVRARLFDAFFTTKPAGRGTGLGLFAVDRILRATDGTCEVTSAPGRGTSFTLSWPTAPASARRPPDGVSAAPAVSVPESRGRVLLVEDEPLVRAFMVEILAGAGYAVTEAANGFEALQAVRQLGACDALCIDGVIPGPSSSEIINAFTARFPRRPILLCSGHLPDELAHRGLSGNGVTLLAKPFEPDQLLELLAASACPA